VVVSKVSQTISAPAYMTFHILSIDTQPEAKQLNACSSQTQWRHNDVTSMTSHQALWNAKHCLTVGG